MMNNDNDNDAVPTTANATRQGNAVRNNFILAIMAASVVSGMMAYKLYTTPSEKPVDPHAFVYANITEAKQLDPSIGQPFIDIAYDVLADGEITTKEHALLSDSYKEMIVIRDFMIKQDISKQAR